MAEDTKHARLRNDHCGPNDPGAIPITTNGAAPSWMRRIE